MKYFNKTSVEVVEYIDYPRCYIDPRGLTPEELLWSLGDQKPYTVAKINVQPQSSFTRDVSTDFTCTYQGYLTLKV